LIKLDESDDKYTLRHSIKVAIFVGKEIKFGSSILFVDDKIFTQRHKVAKLQSIDNKHFASLHLCYFA
jgi:hypothetical protein